MMGIYTKALMVHGVGAGEGWEELDLDNISEVESEVEG